MSLKALVKGWIGEALGAYAHWRHLDPSVYTPLNNITIRTTTGTTQIDHIIVSRHGVFVVEAKNIDGWIFGGESEPQWTVSKFGKKFRFQNPLRQNYRHTRALSEFLGLDHQKFISIVMFWGECNFKTPMPRNVLSTGYSSFIKSHTNTILSDLEVQLIINALRTGSLPKTWATRREHVDSLKAKFSNTTTCPKCGSPLVLRTAKSGPRAGHQFYGCSAFPRCRHIVDVQPDS